MSRKVLIRVWNDKSDLTYVSHKFLGASDNELIELAKNKCRRYMYDNFGTPLEDSENVKTEILFDFTMDAIINNNYFKEE